MQSLAQRIKSKAQRCSIQKESPEFPESLDAEVLLWDTRAENLIKKLQVYLLISPAARLYQYHMSFCITAATDGALRFALLYLYHTSELFTKIVLI